MSKRKTKAEEMRIKKRTVVAKVAEQGTTSNCCGLPELPFVLLLFTFQSLQLFSEMHVLAGKPRRSF